MNHNNSNVCIRYAVNVDFTYILYYHTIIIYDVMNPPQINCLFLLPLINVISKESKAVFFSF